MELAALKTTFSSLGSEDSFDQTKGWAVQGLSDAYRAQAEWFVPEVAGNLGAIELAVRHGKGSDRLNVFFAEDKFGKPGDILESFNGVSCPPAGLLVLTSSTQPLLKPHVQYWVCIEPADSKAACVWKFNNQNRAEGFAFERARWSWEFFAGGPCSGAFRVRVKPLPLEDETSASGVR